MASNTVIVFGATGDVGSYTAITAQNAGAKVWLAVRDLKKPIPGLSSEAEKKLGFERVQADLLDAQSVKAAVEKSGAKRAFFYLTFQAKDGMKSAIEALKAGGIELVVFLSSFSITKDLATIPQQDVIPFMHAQAELNLERVFGDHYVALRPGAFASNSVQWYSHGIKSGEIRLYAPQAGFDWIAAEDMGAVAGSILVQGSSEKVVYLAGPQIIQQQDAIELIRKEVTADKDFKVTLIDSEAAKQDMLKHGQPEIVVDYLVRTLGDYQNQSQEEVFPGLKQAQANIEKYTHRKSWTFKDWLVKHKAEFQ